MENLLILGAGGFIGKAVVEKLSEQYPIRAFDRKIVDEFVKYNNVEMVVGNFADSKKFDQYLNGIDTVIHLISTTVPSDIPLNIPQEIEDNVIDLSEINDYSGDSFKEDIDVTMKLLERSDVYDAYYVDLTRHINIPVVRSIIPGMEVYSVDTSRVGKRLIPDKYII